MRMTSLVPATAAGAFVLFACYAAFQDASHMKHAWLFPASLSVLFLLVCLFTVTAEGVFGFWSGHGVRPRNG